MKLLHQRATNLLSSLNDWTFDYIPREKNAIADKYADIGRRKDHDEMERRKSISYTDFLVSLLDVRSYNKIFPLSPSLIPEKPNL